MKKTTNKIHSFELLLIVLIWLCLLYQIHDKFDIHAKTYIQIVKIIYAISLLGMVWLAYEGKKSKQFYRNNDEIT